MGEAQDAWDDADARKWSLNREIPVLDHGFVKLVDHWGDDHWIASRARMSNDLDAATKSVEEDRNLLDFLWRNAHTSPFEMAGFTFEMKLPIFVARQLVRHRTASINEVSARYVELPEEFYIPEDFHLAADKVKQGRSSEVSDLSWKYKEMYTAHMKEAFAIYKGAISNGVSKEEARILLPLATYTRWTWSMDVNNLFKTLTLRADGHAQYEIRVFADAIVELIRPFIPLAVEAWEKHSRYGLKINAHETDLLRETVKFAEEHGFQAGGDRANRILREKLGLPSLEKA